MPQRMVPPPGATRQDVGEDLIVHCAGGNAGEGFNVYVTNQGDELPLIVSFDFSRSKNLKIVGSRSMKMQCRVPSGTCTIAAQLGPVRHNSGYSIEWNVNYEQVQPDLGTILAVTQEQQKKVSTALQGQLALHNRLMAGGLAPFHQSHVLSALREARASHIDIFHPPASAAVGLENADKKACWRRPKEFLPDAAVVKVFEQGVQANDIAQGELGNCWFMCALAAICEFPSLVDRLFTVAWAKTEAEASAAAASSDGSRTITDRPWASAEGLYQLCFCHNGRWVAVTIDDHVPCRPTPTGGPLFSRAKGGELWVVLVEKAYSKLQSSYGACRLGLPSEALVDLTGCPAMEIDFGTERVAFEDLWSWDRNDCVICASTPGVDTMTEGGRGSGKAGGLVPGHAYTVVQVREIRSRGRYHGSRVLQMRNPWGAFEWKGAWSDGSPELRACASELADDGIDTNECVGGDDGMFWMAFDDFIAHFCAVSVCAAHLLQPGSTFDRPSDLLTTPDTRGLPASAASAASASMWSTPGGHDRYVPPRLRRHDAEREDWYEARLRTCLRPSHPDATAAIPGGAAYSGGASVLRATDCFVLEVPPLEQRKATSRRSSSLSGVVRAAHAKRAHVATLFTLSQADTRHPSAAGYADAGMVLYKVSAADAAGGASSVAPSPGGGLEEVGYAPLGARRNALLEAHLDVGTYVLVVVTGGTRPRKRPPPPSSGGSSGAMRSLLGGGGGGAYKPAAGCALSASVHGALTHLFEWLDADLDGKLGRADLSSPLAAPFVAACGIDLTPASAPLAPNAILKLADYENETSDGGSGGGLTCAHLELALLAAWGASDPMWGHLFKAMHYDEKTLAADEDAPRPVTIAMHSSQRLSLRRTALPAMVADAALCHVVKTHGKSMRAGPCVLYALTTKSGAVFCATNGSNTPMALQIDCTGSSNVRTRTDGMVSTAALPTSGEATLCTALMQEDVDKAWSFRYAFKTQPAGGIGGGGSLLSSSPPMADLAASLAALATATEPPGIGTSAASELPRPARLPPPAPSAGGSGAAVLAPAPRRQTTPATTNIAATPLAPPVVTPAPRATSTGGHGATPAYAPNYLTVEPIGSADGYTTPYTGDLAGLVAASTSISTDRRQQHEGRDGSRAEGSSYVIDAADTRTGHHQALLLAERAYDPNYRGPILFTSGTAARQKIMMRNARDVLSNEREAEFAKKSMRKAGNRGGCMSVEMPPVLDGTCAVM